MKTRPGFCMDEMTSEILSRLPAEQERSLGWV
jgi:hypothetical protein